MFKGILLHATDISIETYMYNGLIPQIVVKGILAAEDAMEAVRHGVDAVWVSNHGGRQLDTVAATIEALPEV